MSKTLVLIRHAHRDTSDREADNGLSEKGRRQAAWLLKHYGKAFPEAQPLILSSPKRRCVETVQAIAELAGVEVQRSKLLREQGKGETAADLQLRVGEFLDWWRSEGPELAIACSHGDWLPLAVETATGGRVEFKKGAWAQIELVGRRPLLTWLIQGISIAQSR